MPKRTRLLLSVSVVAGAAALLFAQAGARDANSRPPKAGRGDGDGPAVAVSDPQEEELLAALKDKRPEEHRRLLRLKQENPRFYREALAAAWRAYLGWRNLPPDVQKAQQAVQQARLEAFRIGREFAAAKDDAQKQRLRSRLLQVLGQEFDSDQVVREYRLGQLEEQIKRLRAELKDRADRRTQVIERTVSDLLAGGKPEFGPARPRARSRPAASAPAD